MCALNEVKKMEVFMEDIEITKKKVLEDTLEFYSIEKIVSTSEKNFLKIILKPKQCYGKEKEYKLAKNKFEKSHIAIMIYSINSKSIRKVLGIVSDGKFISSTDSDSSEMCNSVIEAKENAKRV